MLAGGQSLVPLLNMRLARPVAPRRREPRRRARPRSSSTASVRIGALTRQADVLASRELAAAAPAARRGAAPRRPSPPPAAAGTIGGSLAHADPAAELPAVLLALDGEVVASEPDGASGRSPPPTSSLGPFTTALAPDELLTDVVLPRRSTAGRSASPSWSAATATSRSPGRSCILLEPARLVLFGVGGTPRARARGGARRSTRAPPPPSVADLARATSNRSPTCTRTASTAVASPPSSSAAPSSRRTVRRG